MIKPGNVSVHPTNLKLALHALRKNQLVNHVFTARPGAEAPDFLVRPRLAQPRGRSAPDSRDRAGEFEECDVVSGCNGGTDPEIVKPVDFAQSAQAVQAIGKPWLLLDEPPRKPNPNQENP